MSAPCAIKWCAALAADSDYCVVHARKTDIHPQELGEYEAPEDKEAYDEGYKMGRESGIDEARSALENLS